MVGWAAISNGDVGSSTGSSIAVNVERHRAQRSQHATAIAATAWRGRLPGWRTRHHSWHHPRHHARHHAVHALHHLVGHHAVHHAPVLHACTGARQLGRVATPQGPPFRSRVRSSFRSFGGVCFPCLKCSYCVLSPRGPAIASAASALSGTASPGTVQTWGLSQGTCSAATQAMISRTQAGREGRGDSLW